MKVSQRGARLEVLDRDSYRKLLTGWSTSYSGVPLSENERGKIEREVDSRAAHLDVRVALFAVLAGVRITTADENCDIGLSFGATSVAVPVTSERRPGERHAEIAWPNLADLRAEALEALKPDHTWDALLAAVDQTGLSLTCEELAEAPMLIEVSAELDRLISRCS